MTNKTYIVGALLGACLLSGCGKTPIEFTDTLRGYSVDKTDAKYSAQFSQNNSVKSPKGSKDSNGYELESGDVYRVTGYQNLFGRQAKTIERIVDN